MFTIFVSGAKVVACAACSEKRGVSLPSKTTGAPVKSIINHKRTRKTTIGLSSRLRAISISG